jgi:hypothetical protein
MQRREPRYVSGGDIRAAISIISSAIASSVGGMISPINTTVGDAVFLDYRREACAF